MTTTVQAVYDEGVLRLSRRLPLAPHSEVSVTVELPDITGNSGVFTSARIVWPDVSARLGALYGATVLPENAVLAARSDDRF
jgi:predicted DNA-binding antitoxin AbrB/MazE fold protein